MADFAVTQQRWQAKNLDARYNLRKHCNFKVFLGILKSIVYFVRPCVEAEGDLDEDYSNDEMDELVMMSLMSKRENVK